MPFKLDANGNIVMAEHNGKKLPVFINDKTKEEAPFDADSTVETIARINGEAKAHREAKEAAEGKLATFTGLDPVKAKEALELVGKLDAKKLVDAGEIDRVKAEIGKSFQTQIDALTGEKTALSQKLVDQTMTAAFNGSEFIKTKVALPADFIQARFGANFGIENDKLYAVDASGNKIYSPTRPGELANFDEAMEVLVKAHPQRDTLLKGSGASGGGANGGQGQGGGGGGGQGQGNIGGNRGERTQAIAGRFPELAGQN